MKPPRPRSMSRRAAVAGLAGVAGAGVVGCRRGWTPPEADPTGRALAKPHVAGAEAYATHEERWFHSACGQCPAGCGIRVRVIEGRAVRIEGDRDNPLNRGGIGARGLAALQGLYDADRLTGPLRRAGGRLVPVSWDEALDEVAAALTALRAAGTPERLLVWCGHERGLTHELFARLARAFGTPSFVDGRPAHSGTLARVMEETLGVAELPVWGWEGAAQVLSLEAGLLEGSCQAVYFTRMAAQRRRGARTRAHLVHAGPAFDLSAYNADQWLRIAPGTSGALALGLARLILERHPERRELPETLVAGAGALREVVAAYTPAHVTALTGISARDLVRLAEELDDHRPSFAYVDGQSLAFSSADTARAAMALNAVLELLGRAGGVRAPPSPLPPWPEARARRGGGGGAGNRPVRRRAGGDRGRAPASPLPPRQPAYARPAARWREPSPHPLVVSFSPYRDETVEAVADLVLPDHTFLERWELATPAPALDRAILTRRVPVVAPLHDTRPSGDVVLALARRVGGAVATALPWPTFREATEARLAGLDDRGQAHAGFWLGAEPAPAPARVTVRPGYEPPAWAGDPARFPLRLLLHRPLGHAEGSGANLPWLRMLAPMPGAAPWSFVARVHPDSAPGVRDGAEVALTSELGSIRIRVRLDERVQAGYVVVPLGGGHDAFGRWARGFGANAMDLIGAGPLCATRVRIERGGA
ncbi:MAG: molybdopterin-dependent oxidoreductase [Kofleriaceae bacterium]|nr:molybdopterin-dependent oxidoreductase [Kofleriaceae bacterium]